MSVTLELAPSESLVYLYSALLSESFADDRDGYPDYEGKARCRVNIVDTLIFLGGQPVRWLWTDETRGTVHTRSGRNWSVNDIIRAFRRRESALRGMKHAGPPQLRSCVAVVWYRTTAQRLSQRVVGEAELLHLLRHRGFSLQVLAVQIFLGGCSLKGSGWFEHRVWRSDARVEFHQTFELMLPPEQPATIDLTDFMEGGRFAASTYSQTHVVFSTSGGNAGSANASLVMQQEQPPQRLVVTEAQHYYAQAATSEVLRHLENYYSCRVLDATFIMAFNSTWAPFVLGVRDVRLADVPVGVVQMRHRLFGSFEEVVARTGDDVAVPQENPDDAVAVADANATSDEVQGSGPQDSDEEEEEEEDRHRGQSLMTATVEVSAETKQEGHETEGLFGCAKDAVDSDDDEFDDLGRQRRSTDFDPSLRQLPPSGGSINKLYQIQQVTNLAANVPAVGSPVPTTGTVSGKSRKGHVMVGSMDATPYTAQLRAAGSSAASGGQEHSHLQDYALSYGIGLRTKKGPGFLYERELREKRNKTRMLQEVQNEASAYFDKMETNINAHDAAMHDHKARPHHRQSTEASAQLALAANAHLRDCGNQTWSEALSSMRSPLKAKTAAKSMFTAEAPLSKTANGPIPTGFHGLLPNARSGTGIERRMPSSQVYKGRPHCFGEFCRLDPASVYEEVRRTREIEQLENKQQDSGDAGAPASVPVSPIVKGVDSAGGISALKKRYNFGALAMQAVTSKIEDSRKKMESAEKAAEAPRDNTEHSVVESPVRLERRQIPMAQFEVAFKSVLMARVESGITNFDYLSIVLEYAQLGFEVEDIMSECARLALLRVAEICRDEAYRMACSLVPRSGSGGGGGQGRGAVNPTTANLMEEAHRNLIYNDALAKVHPSKFYQTVPVCETCFRLYSSMDTQREDIVFGRGKRLPSAGKGRGRGASPARVSRSGQGRRSSPSASPSRARPHTAIGGMSSQHGGGAYRNNSNRPNFNDSQFPISPMLPRAKAELSYSLPYLGSNSRPRSPERPHSQGGASGHSRVGSADRTSARGDRAQSPGAFNSREHLQNVVHTYESSLVELSRPVSPHRPNTAPVKQSQSEDNRGESDVNNARNRLRNKDKFFSREISDRRSSAVPVSYRGAHLHTIGLDREADESRPHARKSAALNEEDDELHVEEGGEDTPRIGPVGPLLEDDSVSLTSLPAAAVGEASITAADRRPSGGSQQEASSHVTADVGVGAAEHSHVDGANYGEVVQNRHVMPHAEHSVTPSESGPIARPAEPDQRHGEVDGSKIEDSGKIHNDSGIQGHLGSDPAPSSPGPSVNIASPPDSRPPVSVSVSVSSRPKTSAMTRFQSGQSAEILQRIGSSRFDVSGGKSLDTLTAAKGASPSHRNHSSRGPGAATASAAIGGSLHQPPIPKGLPPALRQAQHVDARSL